MGWGVVISWYWLWSGDDLLTGPNLQTWNWKDYVLVSSRWCCPWNPAAPAPKTVCWAKPYKKKKLSGQNPTKRRTLSGQNPQKNWPKSLPTGKQKAKRTLFLQAAPRVPLIFSPKPPFGLFPLSRSGFGAKPGAKHYERLEKKHLKLHMAPKSILQSLPSFFI